MGHQGGLEGCDGMAITTTGSADSSTINDVCSFYHNLAFIV